jgi:hypothetical protein
MATSDATEKRPLWLLIEENILELGSQDLSKENLEASIQRIAGNLDNAGCNVSRHGGNMLQLRWALDQTSKAGRPLMKDFNTAVAAFKLEDLADLYGAVNKLIDDIGQTWPKFKRAERRADVIGIVEKAKLDLLVAKADGLPDDEGIRLFIEEQLAPEVITNALDITDEKLKQVNAENNVSEELIIEIAKVDQGAIDGAKQAMEAELKEKQRLEEEAAAKKKAEAAGPSLEDIPSDEMLDHIEAIREIMEFSDQEKEIRVMCEQSSIPQALVDIAVSEPDKLDELEKAAEG